MLSETDLTLTSPTPPSSTKTATSKANSYTKDRLSLFEADETRTTVPFYNVKEADRTVIRAAKRQAAKQIKAFDDIFNK